LVYRWLAAVAGSGSGIPMTPLEPKIGLAISKQRIVSFSNSIQFNTIQYCVQYYTVLSYISIKGSMDLGRHLEQSKEASSLQTVAT
jgi:hypothetical protein